MKKNIRYIILSILFISFVILTFAVINNKTEGIDNAVYNLLTIFKNDTITSIYKFITFFGSTKFIVLLCLIFLVIFWRTKKGVIITGCLIVSTIINNVIKLLIKRERPIDLMLVKESTYSFPSGHTMASVSMYGFLIYLVWKSNFNKSLKILLTIFLSLVTLSIAASRIYLGAHFATDIIGAILVSSMWLIIFISFIEHKKYI